MQTYKHAKYLSFITLSSILVACGGGGATKPPSTTISSAVSSASSAPASSVSSVASSAASSTAALKALIKLNQIGYKPSAEKLAVIPAVAATTFTVTKTSDNSVVLTGNLSAAQTWSPADESVKLADFSSLTAEGEYTLTVAGIEKSASFKIATNAYDALNAGAIKAFYFNRASTELLETHAGIYKRAAGHPGTKVYIHKSAATAARPEGTIVSAPKGWYDAGDYNLYIVNSGISTYTMLAAYEHHADYFKTQNLNIPESGDAVPDVLNEAMWNLEWMLAMQDPNDGGVYHKLTSKNFSGMVMPDADTSDRFMVQKATPATLDFAAVMAVASRIYAPYEATYPGLSAKMLNAAKSAYQWAKANPALYYVQPSDISTGGYGDNNATDEFAWAAAELYITTKDNAYYTDLNPSAVTADVPSWPGVKSLGWISLAHNVDSLTGAADKALIKNRLDGLATTIVAKKAASAYGVPLVDSDFNWGSNSGALNQAMMLLAAYKLDNSKTDYLKTAQSLLDYVLGRNPTDFSYVTGFGVRTPQNIHHRPSEADGIAGSIPGFLAGGANPGQQDKSGCGVPYPSNLPAKSYLDNTCSYASNEIAINWNAPLVYVSAALQVLTP
ncbi:MAG TPA: glycoside hydrolase family 9 protein [Cellvibrio sp.]|nr:glycoside hydrolase family 9 protein [Cellvibrio sp.]